jgi:hypothetical protein
MAEAGGCASFEYEVVAAGVSGDLAYIVGIKRTTASIGAAAPQLYFTTGHTDSPARGWEWKVVHRHAHPYKPEAEKVAAELTR